MPSPISLHRNYMGFRPIRPLYPRVDSAAPGAEDAARRPEEAGRCSSSNAKLPWARARRSHGSSSLVPSVGPAQNADPFTRVPGELESELRVVCSTKLPVALVSGLRFIDTPSVPASVEE